jgi:predicted nucleic acid-binding protein
LIFYLDTSSLVKLYVEELHAEKVREWVKEAELVATCRIALPETISALDRRFKNRDFSKKDYQLLIERFNKDWLHFIALDFDETEAGRLVRKHGLKGFDAIHLSSVKILRGNADLDLFFSSFDEKLNKAALAENIRVLSP